jgi:hypothetical protein
VSPALALLCGLAAAAGGVLALAFLYGFVRPMITQLRRLGGKSALGLDDARMVWGTCLLIQRGLLLAAVVVACMACAEWLSPTSAVLIAASCGIGAFAIRQLGASRTRASRRAGGFGPRP